MTTRKYNIALNPGGKGKTYGVQIRVTSEVKNMLKQLIQKSGYKYASDYVSDILRGIHAEEFPANTSQGHLK